MMKQFVACALLACLLSIRQSTAQSETVNILVPNGPIVGERYLVQNKNVNRFLGVPYAKPPVGSLRFRKPEPIGKWGTPVEATKWPSHCYQFHYSVLKFKHLNFSEDCLYLNIWSPEVNANEQSLRPVLVWIHGGGLIVGSSGHDTTDMETLSVMADAIMVSFNYR